MLYTGMNIVLISFSTARSGRVLVKRKKKHFQREWVGYVHSLKRIKRLRWRAQLVVQNRHFLFVCCSFVVCWFDGWCQFWYIWFPKIQRFFLHSLSAFLAHERVCVCVCACVPARVCVRGTGLVPWCQDALFCLVHTSQRQIEKSRVTMTLSFLFGAYTRDRNAVCFCVPLSLCFF